MHILGAQFARQVADGELPSMKAVFNSSGVIFFPTSEEHRNQKAAGLSYEDDYAGSALAALISNGKIEIRYHRDFGDTQVQAIVQSIASQPELSFLLGWRLIYQGRELKIDN